MILKRSDVPQSSAAGRVSTEPRIRISEIGQITFNTFSTNKLLEGAAIEKDKVKEIFLDWDEKTRTLLFSLKVLKGLKESDGWAAKMGKKMENLSMSGASLFRHTKYDFVASGAQTISATSHNGSITVRLPEKLEPQPKQARKPRTKKVDTTVNGVDPTVVQETELALV